MISKTNNLCSWRKVGAVSLPIVCLSFPLFRCKLNDADEDDKTSQKMNAIQAANSTFTDLLIEKGFSGKLLKMKIK